MHTESIVLRDTHRTALAPPPLSDAVRHAPRRAGHDVLAGMARPAPAVAGPATAQQPPDLGPDPAPDLRSAWPPLLAILVFQAILSIRLVWSSSAFQDEALYVWSGHLEIAHLLHGAPAPVFQTYFSGAPVIYPVLAAAADHVGGLAVARLLSLGFMLAATALGYDVTRRLYDRRSALFAAALFAGTGAAQFMSAFATYDALALCLLAAATWLGVRAASCGPRAQLLLLVLASMALTLADAAKYAAALFDPVVVAVAALAVWRLCGRRAGLAAAACMTLVTAGILDAALNAGGYPYWQGITFTTLSRAAGASSSFGIWYVSAGWVGAIVILAIVGVAVTGHYGGRPAAALAGTLAAATFLAPAEQARIHVFISLFKHVGFGAWFGSIVAGYALASLARAVPSDNRQRASRLGVIAVILCAALGVTLAGNHFAEWPNSASFIARLRPIAAAFRGPVLLENESVPAYYLSSDLPWRRLSDTYYFNYINPASGQRQVGAAAYADAIHHKYFTVVALAADAPIDRAIAGDLKASKHYKLAVVIPFATTDYRGSYRIWVRDSAGRHRG
jgi:Dolichyl-phosphate-mannose-protein mannosyltransferase